MKQETFRGKNELGGKIGILRIQLEKLIHTFPLDGCLYFWRDLPLPDRITVATNVERHWVWGLLMLQQSQRQLIHNMLK